MEACKRRERAETEGKHPVFTRKRKKGDESSRSKPHKKEEEAEGQALRHTKLQRGGPAALLPLRFKKVM
ncbi:hypothetical protein cyc_04939 [Cyclospora cayetanensis]|uniref:Uncharacterized protein n=1 Tax=Cyclospora cayetanensis TaxID=88456 RepID=A0A1D3CVX3_9EIME|nr:hypothetical protein cyc_04939 [Cyclospora cayetanensis]